MPNTTYRLLPLETLYKLLEGSTKDMLSAVADKDADITAFKAYKKQVEIIIQAIDEKKKERQDDFKVA